MPPINLYAMILSTIYWISVVISILLVAAYYFIYDWNGKEDAFYNMFWMTFFAFIPLLNIVLFLVVINPFIVVKYNPYVIKDNKLTRFLFKGGSDE